jgi:transcriptional regulator with XRE-family HTH domain
MMSKTSNAIEIMNRRFGNDADTQARLADERVKSLAAVAIYDARTTAGLTQQQLADRVGTKQPVIARLEDADYEGHTTAMLNRIASALYLHLELRFVPLEVESQANFSADQSTETSTLINSLISEIQSLKSTVNSQMHALKAELTDVKKQVLRTRSNEAHSLPKIAKPDTAKWHMLHANHSSRPSNSSYSEERNDAA